jgi:hypothetical protein
MVLLLQQQQQQQQRHNRFSCMKQNSFLIQNTHKMLLHVDSSSSFHSFRQQITDWKHGEGRGEEVPQEDGIDSSFKQQKSKHMGATKIGH